MKQEVGYLDERSLRAVKPISRSQLNDGYGADCGRSRGSPYRGAIRPDETIGSRTSPTAKRSEGDLAGARRFPYLPEGRSRAAAKIARYSDVTAQAAIALQSLRSRWRSDGRTRALHVTCRVTGDCC